MSDISFDRDGWIEAALGDPVEDATFTRLTIKVDGVAITRNFSKRGGGESDAINVPLFPLARVIAEKWWPLLFEPVRPGLSERFRARHRLDTAMHGYVFPALALCSAGDDSILVDWSSSISEFAQIEFLEQPPPEPVVMERGGVETTLMDVVETALSRVSGESTSYTELSAAWDRVSTSMNDPQELAYCVAAGRLGIDPYDPDSPDLSSMISGLAPELVNDLSEAVEFNEFEETADWVREFSGHLRNAPEIQIGEFGNPIADNLGEPAWRIGWKAANVLRDRIGLNRNEPRQAAQELLGGAVSIDRALDSMNGPSSVAALIAGSRTAARIGTVARSARQQRFRACAATYIAWFSCGSEQRAATVARTRVQQASRAFAAELLAPRQLLRERAGNSWLTAEAIDSMAEDFICPHDAVVLQAYNEGIPLRGVEVPLSHRETIA